MSTDIRNLEEYICAPDTPLRDALRRINATEFLFQVVLDPDRKVLGTLTDGDIRRGLLNGLSLEDRVERCMYRDFKFGSANDPVSIQSQLFDTRRPVKFLPVLDAEGRLVRLESRGEVGIAPAIARAVVMAGGFGTRLGNLTKDTPKPLLPVGGRPILDHVLTALENAGVQEIILTVHYLGDQFQNFIDQRDNRNRVSFIQEKEPLGTAGALSQLPADVAQPTLVVNGDVLTRVDYEALNAFHRRHGLDGTIGVSPYEVQVPYGVVRTGSDGLFSGIEEKPRITEFIAAGIYYLSPQILALLTQDNRTDMPELLNRAREIGLNIGLFPIHEYWIDVGQTNDLNKAIADHEHT